MNVQGMAWLVTLIGLALVTLAFAYVVIQAGKPPTPPRADGRHFAYTLRGWLFAALIVFGVGVTYATLRTYPIPVQQASTNGAQIVQVTAHQWSWELEPDSVVAGTPVEFRVTSADVNHGFAIYGPDERIVTQTQAMPGFTNRLVHTFTAPGTYRILCLEYCGLAHHGMQAEVRVTASKGSRS
jgi:cytochrome c oxidase subunit 2